MPFVESRIDIAVKFRSFDLIVRYYPGTRTWIYWKGPKHWKSEIKTACLAWVKTNGFGGLNLVEYLDAMDIGRNILKSDKKI